MPAGSWRRLLIGLFLVVGVTATPDAPSGAAPVPTQSFVTMFSEPHEGLGDHLARSWRSAKDSIVVTGSADDLVVVQVRGASGDWFNLGFAAPPGERLRVGTFLRAERAPFRSSGRPGIDIAGNGNGCNRVSGHFRVLDIAPDLSRLWLVYEHHCEEFAGALFGEVRYGMPVVDATVSVSGSQVLWPDEPVGWSGRAAEVRIAATSTSSVAVSAASVTGNGFKLLGNTCPAALLPGSECRLTVGFTPISVGTQYGALSVLTDGRTRSVQLEGTGFLPERTWLSQGSGGSTFGDAFAEVSPDFPRTLPSLAGWGSTTDASMDAATGYTDAEYYARFNAPPGQQLVPGVTYSKVTPYPSTTAGVAGMTVMAWGRSCSTVTGSFTVRSATFDGSQMTSYVIDFDHHCNGEAAAYRGSLYLNTGGRPAVIASTASIVAAPATVGYGSSAAVRGTLSEAQSAKPVAGGRVALYARAVGATDWRYRASSTTAGDGSYTFSMRPTRNVDIRVQHFGSLGSSATSSGAFRQSVRPRVTLTSASSDVAVGSTVRLRAQVTPVRPGHPVLLQRYLSGVWKTVQQAKQPSTGPAVFTVRLARAGWQKFRVVTPSDTVLVSGASSAVRVHAS